MMVRIGVRDSAKELELDMDDDVDGASLRSDFEAAIGGGQPMVWLSDRKGREVGIPTSSIAYVDLGEPDSGPRIGFGA